jgi:aspartyl-tRNA(Asn)/glutamyl-tRNA(Gln) amidotransferase subunit B
VLTSEIRVANYYEYVAAKVDPVLAATWVADYLKGELNYRDRDIRDTFGPDKMVYILQQFRSGAITDKGAVEIIRTLLDEGGEPQDVIKNKNLAKVESDITRTACAEVLKENVTAIEDFRSGKAQALNYLVGMVMKKTRGRADPTEVNLLLRELLECT